MQVNWKPWNDLFKHLQKSPNQGDNFHFTAQNTDIHRNSADFRISIGVFITIIWPRGADNKAFSTDRRAVRC